MEDAPFFSDIAEAPASRAFWLSTKDRVRIRIGVTEGGSQGTVLIFPGRTEYVEKYGRCATDFLARGYSTVTVDWRGQGLADRVAADPAIGHVDQFTDYQHDVTATMDALRTLDLPQPWFLIGHSMGGAIGLRALYEGLPVAASAFTGPMWGIQLSAPLVPVAWSLSYLAAAAGFGLRYAPTTDATTYVVQAPYAGNLLTRDEETYAHLRRQLSEHPELALGGPSMQWLNEALKETHALAKRPAPDSPSLCVLGSNERIVSSQAIRKRMESWPKGRLLEVDGGEHELLMELPEDRANVIGQILDMFDQAGDNTRNAA